MVQGGSADHLPFNPTVYRYVVNALPAGQALPTLRLIVLGGEEVSKRDVELYKQHLLPPVSW